MGKAAWQFKFDKRLGISLPVLDKEWKYYDIEEQAQIIAEWEAVRADIPGRIKELENEIEAVQSELNNEGSFKRSCQLNARITELAATINDLNIWFRIQQDTEAKIHR